MKKIILILTLIISTAFILAEIPTYHQFYGYIKNSGDTVLNQNFQIKVYINGVLSETATAENGRYGYTTLLFVKNGVNGNTITFYINDLLSGSYIFENEKTTMLNLTWPCGDGIVEANLGEECDQGNIPSSCTAKGFDSGNLRCTSNCKFDISDCYNDDSSSSSSSSSSSGGGGGGGGGNNQRVICSERWVCGVWSECINGVQTRICTDENRCFTSRNKPEVSRNCIEDSFENEDWFSENNGIELESAQQENASNVPIYFFIGILLTAVIILIIIFKKFRKKDKKINKKNKNIKKIKTEKPENIPLKKTKK